MRLVSATTPEEAFHAYWVRLALVLATMVTSLWSVRLISGVDARRFVWLLSIILLFICFVHVAIMPLNSATISVQATVMPWGETLSTPIPGRAGWWVGPVFLIGFLVQFFALYCCRRLWRRDRVAASLIVMVVAGTLVIYVLEALRSFRQLGVPIVGAVPNVLWVCVIALLIARHHRLTLQELAASEARLSAVIENSPGVAIQCFDREGRVVLWNTASEAMFGFPAHEALGKSLGQLIHTPEEFRLLVEASATIRAADKPIPPTEHSFRRRDGKTGVCISTMFRIPGPHDSDWFACMYVDITARTAAERERELAEAGRRAAELSLRERETFLRLAQEAAHVGSWERDIATNRFKWSDELARIHGIAASEFDGSLATVLSFCHPDELERFQKAMSTAVAGEPAPVGEYRIQRRDGETRDVWYLGRVVCDDDAVPVKVLGVAIDVTERNQADRKRRELEAQLVQAQKLETIGLLSGGIAHDLNNLLTVVSGYCELLGATMPPADKRSDMLEGIQDASLRAAALTRQLLTFSRKQVIEPRALDLNVVVADTEKMLRRLIGEDVALTTHLQSALARVNADPGQISQVILNLAVNARDAMPTGGKLTIETANVILDEPVMAPMMSVHKNPKKGSYVQLTVTDTGTGMTPEVQARLFEPFFTTKGFGKGTGLGLATVRTIVEECGGFIHVDSELGRGSTFQLYLPVLESPVAPEPSDDARKSPGGGETVLLVEDEVAVRSVIQHVLERYGYTVQAVSSGAEAIELSKRYVGHIDLLITDVVMPELGGRELAERLSAARPGLRVLYLSGYTDDAVVRHGVLQADVAFLQKPFTMQGLASKVRQTLDANTTPSCV